jgi:diguanylate cyclase (GGDEF)-like protein
VNVTTAGSVATSIAIAAGNTLEGVAGAWLVNRWARGCDAMNRTRDVFLFAILACILSTMVSATIGVTSLSLGGFAAWSDYLNVWVTWWLGDAVGDAVVAPLFLLWAFNPTVRWRRLQIVEAAALLGCLILVGQVVFNGVLISGHENYPLEYLCIPILIWVAFRFGQREVATAIFVLSVVAIWGTMHGMGPFGRDSRNESLLLLQSFLGISAVMTMALAAEVSERRSAEREARSLSVSDPLTGLGNYRKLIDSLEMEMERSERTGRCFAFILLDVDGLKKINDEYGHVVGSRALCRLADVLRFHSRSVDTAARYGGDEFALILPEEDENSARRVCRRISEELAKDSSQPLLSVSVGIAIWARDGRTKESMMRAADRDLYEQKQSRPTALP